VTDDTSLVKQFAELKEKGITIVCCDIYTEGGDFWIASDNNQIGRTSAEEAVKYLEEKNGSPSGKVAILSSKTTTSMIGRAEGFKEVLEQYPDIEIVDEQFPTSFDAPSMMNLTDDMLQKYPTGELDIIFASNQTQLEGANSAIMTAGRQDVALFGVDDSDAIFEALQDENSSMMSTVVQDPIAMGAKAVEMGLKIHNGEPVDSDVYNPDVVLVTRDNVADYIAGKESAVAELSDYYG
jgi:ribose transport system substrate-binding protein